MNNTCIQIQCKWLDRTSIGQLKLHAYKLITIFKYLFTTPYRQIQVKNSFNYVQKEIQHYNRDLCYTLKAVESGLFLYAIYIVSICNLVKICNVRNAVEQKYISTMSGIDVYV